MIDVDTIRHGLFVIGASTARFAAVFSVVPFLGGDLMQGVTRNGVIFSFLLVLYPLIAPTVPDQFDSVLLFGLIMLKEAVIGFLLGFVYSLAFWIAESVGYLVDNQRGATMASIMDPASGEQTTPMGSLLMQMTTVMFFTGGGFLAMLGGIFESYRIWPIFSFYPRLGGEIGMFALNLADTLMRVSALLAAPLIIALFLAEFGLGLVSRFAPQLNVFSLSMPVKSGVSSFLIIVYLPFLTLYLAERLGQTGQLIAFLRGAIE